MKISRKRQHVPGKAQQPSRGAVPLHLLIRRHGLPALGAEPQCAQLMRSAARQYMAEMMIAMRAASTGQAGVADTWPGRQPGLPGWAARACRSGRSAAAAGRAGSRCAGSAARRSGPPARPPPPARASRVIVLLLNLWPRTCSRRSCGVARALASPPRSSVRVKRRTPTYSPSRSAAASSASPSPSASRRACARGPPLAAGASPQACDAG